MMKMAWNGFEEFELEFEGMEASVVLPKIKVPNPVLSVKTEYFNAFPETEIMLLERGFYVANIDNKNRWGVDDDLDRKARFIKYVTEKFGLAKKCVLVGMSCGGLIAIKFAAKYPELVACMYLDAPVLNYMSCPCGFGRGNQLGSNLDEIMNALQLNTIGELMAYRDMPLDRLPKLIESRIPVILVAGDSDTVVPFEENGIFLEKAYRENDIEIEVHIKPGCDHHPHGLENPAIVADFIEKYSK